MVALASAFVRLRPEVNRQDFVKAGTQAGEDAGKGAADGFSKGYKRDVNGKLRDVHGKFVTDGTAAGAKAGQGAGSNFASGFGKGSSGLKKQIASNLKLAAGVFVPIGLGAAVAQIGKIGIAYEDNLNIFKFVSKATGDQMDQVAAKARALGADVKLPGVSAAGAAAAMTELAKAGFTVQQAMDAAQGTLQLARVANISEAEAATIAANAVNAFGIKAGDTGKVVDQLAAAANSSSVEIADVSLAFQQAASVFSGFQAPAVGSQEAITELNTAIAVLGNNGIKGSDAGTSLKQMLLQLTGPTKAAKAEMELLAIKAGGATVSLAQQNDVLHGSGKVQQETLTAILKSNKGLGDQGDIAFTASGKMRSLRDILALTAAGTKGMSDEEKDFAVTQIFGADAARSVIALLKGGLPVYDAQRKAVLQQGAAADFAAAKNKGLGGAIDNVKSQFENAAIAIYGVAKGPLTAFLTNLANQLPGFFARVAQVFGFIRANFGVFRDWALAIAAVTLALKLNSLMLAVTAAGGIVKYIASIRIVAGVTKGWAAAQALLNVTLLANPIGLVIIALTALVAGVILAYRHSATFRAIVQGTWAGIKAAVSATIDFFTKVVWPGLLAGYHAVQGAALFLWHNVIEPVWHGIQTVVGVVVAIVRGYIAGLVFEFNVIKTVALFLWHNVFSPVFSGIQKAVEIAWLAIRIIFVALYKLIAITLQPVIAGFRIAWQIAFSAISAYLNFWWGIALRIFGAFRAYVIGPVSAALSFLRNYFTVIFGAIGAYVSAWYNTRIRPTFAAVRAVWDLLAAGLSAIWTGKIRPLFTAVANFITKDIPNAFRTGVAAVKKAWEGVQAAARVPVAFVVNHVINPFIGGLNNAAKFVGIKDRVAPIAGFARGGQIPGVPSAADNRIAMGPNGLLKVATGEFITNTRSTLANLPLVQAVNRKRGKVTHDDVDPYLDGYANGGMVGDGNGISGFFGKLISGAKGVLGAITDPGGALRKVVNAGLNAIPGGGTLTAVIKGLVGKLVSGAGSFLKSKFGTAAGGPLGTQNVFGGYKGMERLIAARFPGLHVISDFRSGARTLSGNTSYHALGRAVDYPPSRPLAQWIRGTFGSRTKELITPWNDLNLHNGVPHKYTGAIWNQHNFAGGNAHDHWAAAMGGLVSNLTGMPIKLFDKGGAWPSGTLGANMSGRTEYVNANGGTGDTIIFENHGVIGSQAEMDRWLAAGIKRLKNDRKIP